MDVPAPQLSAAERTQRAITQLEEQQLAHELESISRRTAKRRLVLFFGRATFSDNTKYLYLQAVAREKNYEVMWCSFDDNLIAMLKANGLPSMNLAANIDRSIDLLTHAAVAVFCVNPNESLKGSYSLNACLAGAQKLQLWHGVSVKHLLLRLVPHLGLRELTIRRAFYMASQADHVLSTAAVFDSFWRECFGCRQLVRAGFPRNEVLVRPPTALEMLGAEVSREVEAGLSEGRKNVLVVPTWQRGHQTYLNNPEFFTQVLAYGKRHKVNFFFKMHPTYFLQNMDTRKKADGFYLLNPGTDTYPIMSRFDALLTDYSSIMFDYLHTGKPVLSLDLAKDEHQRFEPDYSLVPDVNFRHKFTAQDLEKKLSVALHDDQLGEQRQEMLRRIFETDPARASEQLLNLIDRLVERAVASEIVVDHCGV
jgi:CDP-glycerol glycerophosphotransferase